MEELRLESQFFYQALDKCVVLLKQYFSRISHTVTQSKQEEELPFSDMPDVSQITFENNDMQKYWQKQQLQVDQDIWSNIVIWKNMSLNQLECETKEDIELLCSLCNNTERTIDPSRFPSDQRRGRRSYTVLALRFGVT